MKNLNNTTRFINLLKVTKMVVLVKECYIVGMIIFGSLFAGCLISSSTNKFILSHDHCTDFPDIKILSRSQIDDEISKIIYDTKNRLVVMFRNSDVSGILDKIDFNKFDVDIYYTNEMDLSRLSKYSKVHLYNYTSDLDFNAIISDKSIYIVPNYFTNQSEGNARYIQRIKCSTCNALYNDIVSYINLFRHEINIDRNKYTYLPYYNQSMIGHSTAVRPTIIKNGSLFMFHSPQNYQKPLRVAANYVLNASFSHFPKELYVYTRNFPLTDVTASNSYTAPPIYILLKTLILSQNTKVKILASINQKSPVIYSLPCYNNVELKLYDDSYKGPNFIVADDELFLFSSNLDTVDKTLESLHMEIRDYQARYNVLQFFDKVWNNSEATNCEFK